MLDRLVEKVRQSVLNAAQKDSARYDGARDFLGVDNRGGDQLPTLNHCRGDHEVIDLDRRDAGVRGHGAKKLASAVAIDRLRSRLRSGYQSSCSRRRSGRGLVNDGDSRQVSVSIISPCPD